MPGTGASPQILGLADIGPAMLPLVGGKAANLGVLTAAGLSVPEGFCLTTSAYRQATGADGHVQGRLSELHAALKATADDDLAALAALAARAREVVLSAPVPPETVEAIERAYGAMGNDVPVAVRSSATAEDLPSASFAGQQDTYLNVVGTASVGGAVRNCWASLWTDRAVSY
ncbi:MAG TPA: PEP/pyruvate-binding domain-containing protein, partial [Arthrobacter sp.]|nr:PEP/pyruvate-binding domain-containing protein [Arthrobacter sp.]